MFATHVAQLAHVEPIADFGCNIKTLSPVTESLETHLGKTGKGNYHVVASDHQGPDLYTTTIGLSMGWYTVGILGPV